MFFSLFPLRIHYFFSNILYLFFYKIFRYRRDTVITNLSRSFPEMKYKEIKKLSSDYYRFMSDIIVEAIWAFTASTKSISKHISFEGNQVIQNAYDKNKGVIIVMGHLGNWELFTGLPSFKETYGINIDNKSYHFVYKKPSNKISALAIIKIRTLHDSCSIIESKNVFRHILNNTDHRGVYVFLADQSPSKETKFEVNFLNQHTYMIEGPEVLARKLGMPVVYYGIDRVGRGKYVAYCKPICDDASKCESGFVTSKYAQLLENDIIANKATWLWSHKRWKM